MQDDSTTNTSFIDQATTSSQAAINSHSSGTISFPPRQSTINSYDVTDTTSLTLPVHIVSNARVNFLANLFHVKEPHSYDVACKSPHWVHAMQKELKALKLNQTWELTALLEGKRPISSKMGIQD